MRENIRLYALAGLITLFIFLAKNTFEESKTKKKDANCQKIIKNE
jgi:hypothetical protein